LYAIPVTGAIQGHPKAGHLWQDHIVSLAINLECPYQPVKPDEKLKHFVTLNYTEATKVLVGKDMLTFEQVQWDQKHCHPITE
jgi:hypothetical protein